MALGSFLFNIGDAAVIDDGMDGEGFLADECNQIDVLIATELPRIDPQDGHQANGKPQKPSGK